MNDAPFSMQIHELSKHRQMIRLKKNVNYLTCDLTLNS